MLPLCYASTKPWGEAKVFIILDQHIFNSRSCSRLIILCESTTNFEIPLTMTRGCVFIPVTAEDMGFTLDSQSGISRRRNRNRRGNKSKNNLRYRTSDGLWASLFAPEESESSSEMEDVEFVMGSDQKGQCQKQQCEDLVVLEDSDSDDSFDSDIEVEFVDNRRRRRNKRRQERRRRMRVAKQKQVVGEEEDIVAVESSSESDDNDSDVEEECILDFSSNLQSLKEADAVINEDNDKYEFSLQLADVTPENITVSLKDQVLTISAMKEEVSDDGCTKLLQQLTKKIILPENVLEKELKSSLSPNGLLKIEAPLAKPQPVALEGKSIPIQIEIEESTN
ncbi:unnamed protein product [Allacma fusca]|uniref:SHSP domain-containing protein n=1 Tax=Allacma fusca TaxID=39272 RepID=A0A8J2JFA3_9HEXA|nr:unnamed protein product [Allacma fusca]